MNKTVRLFAILIAIFTLLSVLPVQAAGASYSVSGLDVPQAGEKIDFSAVSDAPSEYAVEEVCWYASSREGMFDITCLPGDTFAAGNYLCRVYLTSVSGTLTTENAVGKIGGEAAIVGTYRGRIYLECEYTAKPSTRISSLLFSGIEPPAVGSPAIRHSSISADASAGCTVTEVKWSLEGEVLAPQITFRTGDRATCTVTVRAKQGYRFTEQPTAVLCGKTNSAAVARVPEEEYQFIFLFTVGAPATAQPTGVKIASASVALDAPVAEKTVDMTAEASTGVTVEALNWSPAGDTFAEGERYTVTVVLSAKEGFYFADKPVVTLGGKSMQLAHVTADSLSASFTFPPAEKEDNYVFPFTDVTENDWYYTWVKGAHRMGLINGKSDTLYAPGAEMTWAEAVKLAACMHQLYHTGKVTLENGDPWYKSYMDYCLHQNLIAYDSTGIPGYAELMGMANQPITRAAYVFLFSRALPEEALPAINEIPDNTIPDVPTSDSTLDDSIYLFYRAGILNGTDGYGTFLPDANIQRSDVAAILMRMMDASYRVAAPALLGKQ